MAQSTKKLSVLEKRFLEILDALPDANDGVVIHDIQAKMEGVDLSTLAKVVNALLRKSYIEIIQQGTVTKYKRVLEQEKEKTEELEKEEKLVYNFIKQVGAEGIWVRTLANRTNLHQNILLKALKKLEQRMLVKTVKSVKHGNKKLYMLYEIQPSNEVTGGVWFTEQELDVDFVETVARSCLRFIAQHSFPADPASIYPPNYNGYPTLSKIVKHIRASKISNVPLSATDLEMVLDMLVFDNKIERLPMPAEPLMLGNEDDDDDDDSDDAWMYKSVREKYTPTGVSQMPCGICPVRAHCSPQGPVNPTDCEYLTTWLSF